MDLALSEFCGNAAYFLDRPTDQWGALVLLARVVFGGEVALA